MEPTKREREVAKAVAGGATYGEAAASLGLSKRTVEWHVANLAAKLGDRPGSPRFRVVLFVLNTTDDVS